MLVLVWNKYIHTQSLCRTRVDKPCSRTTHLELPHKPLLIGPLLLVGLAPKQLKGVDPIIKRAKLRLQLLVIQLQNKAFTVVIHCVVSQYYLSPDHVPTSKSSFRKTCISSN